MTLTFDRLILGLLNYSLHVVALFFFIKSHSQANFESKLDKAIPNACKAHIGYR